MKNEETSNNVTLSQVKDELSMEMEKALNDSKLQDLLEKSFAKIT